MLIEAVKMRRCPGVTFADGPTGRRAKIAGTGIDIWELNRKEGSAILADKLMNILSNRVDLIVLAGFLSILDHWSTFRPRH